MTLTLTINANHITSHHTLIGVHQIEQMGTPDFKMKELEPILGRNLLKKELQPILGQIDVNNIKRTIRRILNEPDTNHGAIRRLALLMMIYNLPEEHRNNVAKNKYFRQRFVDLFYAHESTPKSGKIPTTEQQHKSAARYINNHAPKLLKLLRSSKFNDIESLAIFRMLDDECYRLPQYKTLGPYHGDEDFPNFLNKWENGREVPLCTVNTDFRDLVCMPAKRHIPRIQYLKCKWLYSMRMRSIWPITKSGFRIKN